jgi:hypothetical protein
MINNIQSSALVRFYQHNKLIRLRAFWRALDSLGCCRELQRELLVTGRWRPEYYPAPSKNGGCVEPASSIGQFLRRKQLYP